MISRQMSVRKFVTFCFSFRKSKKLVMDSKAASVVELVIFWTVNWFQVGWKIRIILLKVNCLDNSEKLEAQNSLSTGGTCSFKRLFCGSFSLIFTVPFLKMQKWSMNIITWCHRTHSYATYVIVDITCQQTFNDTRTFSRSIMMW